MLKEKLIAYLEGNRGVAVSGGRLALELGVTRAAVWKCVEKLRTEGYPIEGKSGEGYRLKPISDLLSREGVVAALKHPERYRIEVYDCVGSTSDEAAILALRSAPHGTVVIGQEQTGGRGRQNGTFDSPRAEGVYLSMILRNPMGSDEETVSKMEEVVCRLLDVERGEVRGDVMKNGKKAAGILLESMCEAGVEQPRFSVLGVGVYAKLNENFPLSRNRLAAAMIEGFFEGEPQNA